MGLSGTEGGRTRLTYFAEEGVFFKTSECPRFCIKRVFFCNQVGSMGFRVCCRKRNRQRIIKSEVKIRVPFHPMSLF